MRGVTAEVAQEIADLGTNSGLLVCKQDLRRRDQHRVRSPYQQLVISLPPRREIDWIMKMPKLVEIALKAWQQLRTLICG